MTQVLRIMSDRRRAIAVAMLVVLSLAACQHDGPVAPKPISPIGRLKADGFRCVRDGGTPADTIALGDDGNCPAGFDVVPWT
jgi:hypothetical protein